jgi:hypothetical protein
MISLPKEIASSLRNPYVNTKNSDTRNPACGRRKKSGSLEPMERRARPNRAFYVKKPLALGKRTGVA